MINVSLSTSVRQCEHCNTKLIKRTFHIQANEEEIYIGRVCLSNIIDMDTSGNPARAREKIFDYLQELELQEGIDHVEELISSWKDND